MERVLLSTILTFSVIWQYSNAFVPTARHLTPITSCDNLPKIMTLTAKRRRRKDAPKPTTSDELPEFDIEDDALEAMNMEKPEVTKATPPPPPKKSTIPTEIKRGSGLNAQLAEELGGNVDGLDEELILSTMRGQGEAWQPPKSIEDTLRDRSLEKYMNFDKMIEEDRSGEAKIVELPTMEEVISRRKKREATASAVQEGRIEEAAMLIDTEGMGKKAAKKAERKAAALQRESEEANDGGFNLEEVNVLKLLENGAWVGIGLLVAWKIYINSPFFKRAAPLIPPVFE